MWEQERSIEIRLRSTLTSSVLPFMPLHSYIRSLCVCVCMHWKRSKALKKVNFLLKIIILWKLQILSISKRMFNKLWVKREKNLVVSSAAKILDSRTNRITLKLIEIEIKMQSNFGESKKKMSQKKKKKKRTQKVKSNATKCFCKM